MTEVKKLKGKVRKKLTNWSLGRKAGAIIESAAVLRGGLALLVRQVAAAITLSRLAEFRLDQVVDLGLRTGPSGRRDRLCRGIVSIGLAPRLWPLVVVRGWSPRWVLQRRWDEVFF